VNGLGVRREGRCRFRVLVSLVQDDKYTRIHQRENLQENGSVCVSALSLCLSRACLGKMYGFI
jgi:hypothetical protein